MQYRLVTLFASAMLIFTVTVSLTAAVYAQDAEPRPKDELIADITAASEPQMLMSRFSEDLKWDFQVIRHDCTPVDPGGGMSVTEMAYEALIIHDMNDATAEPQVIADQVLQCQGLGAFGLAIMHLSEDHRYLYYTDAREGQPDGGITAWLPTMFRVDLEDLSTMALGGGVFSTWRDLLITFEPNPPGQPVERLMHLYDTRQAEPLASFNIRGEVVWLPDNSGALIIEGDRHLGNYAIVSLIDVETLELTRLLESGEAPAEAAETE